MSYKYFCICPLVHMYTLQEMFLREQLPGCRVCTCSILLGDIKLLSYIIFPTYIFLNCVGRSFCTTFSQKWDNLRFIDLLSCSFKTVWDYGFNLYFHHNKNKIGYLYI